MLRIYSCIAAEHNPWLVALAAVICAVATLLALLIVQRAAALRGRQRTLWLMLAAVATGLGIWSTHFVAMLAWQSHLHAQYDVPLTLLSVAAAIAISGAGWWLELRTARRSWSAWPALVLASGIATMHFIGMQALRISGVVLWDRGYVLMSLAIGLAATIFALFARRRLRRWAVPAAASLYLVAICGLHFTAMSALSVLPGPAAIEQGIEPTLLAVMVGAAALMLMLVGAMAVWLESQRERQRAAAQMRLEDFANAAVEGLAVVEGDRIVDANMAFRHLTGWTGSSLLIESIPALTDQSALEGLLASPVPVELELFANGGEAISVEATARVATWRNSDHLIVAVTDIRERKSAEATIHHLAYHDPLTGIANRALFRMSLIEAIERLAPGRAIAVLCFDLDRFKLINDVYGHATGDQLLRHVADQIRACSPNGAVAARLGGDECAVFIESDDAVAAASSFSSRLLSRLKQPVMLNEHVLRASASIGIALIAETGSDGEEVMRHADLALYRAKAEGRGGYRFFEPDMDAIARSRAQLEADLRLAIDKEQLFVDYQPLVGVASGQIEGFEALVRWQHPERGLVLPDTFVPVAEDSGLIVELGEWVLMRACEEACTWDSPLRVSVNVSPIQFAYADVADLVARVLGETGLPAEQLELEITEGVLIRDPSRSLEQLERVRAQGVHIVMDDFGTGYSCLSYFREFPFDKVKIDRTFVHEMLEDGHARSIVEAVISLGRGLGLQVVAEGVELEAQLDLLQRQGCSQVQGYFLSRPGPIEQFATATGDRTKKPVDELKRRA